MKILLALCLSTGLVASSFLGPAYSEDYKKEISVLTYNVWGLPHPIGQRLEHRFKHIGQHLRRNSLGLDLVGLQECFSEHSAIIHREANFPHIVKGPTGGPLAGSGLVIYSVYRVVYERGVVWKNCNGVFDQSSDCLASKGFLMVRVMIPNIGELDFYDLHADAGWNDGDVRARSSQIGQLIEFVKSEFSTNPVIIVGDFNFTARTPDQELYRHFKDELRLTDPLDGKDPSTMSARNSIVRNDNPDYVPQRYDFIFYRGSDKVEIAFIEGWVVEDFKDLEGGDLSDHFPVYVRLGLSRRD